MAGYYDPYGYWVSTDDTDYSSVDDPANYPRSEDNPAGYDPSASYNQPLSGITSLLTPFKGIFDRLKSGNTTANDVNAALGVLGLIMPSLNRPQTKGWKGSIDLTKQYTRTPIAQPAYTPYAQSASPVMGRQFFNTTYGAAPVAPPAAPSPSIPAPAPVEQAAAPTYSAASAPSAAPVAAPTAAPTAAPVAAPVASPAPAARAGIASLSSSNTAAPAPAVRVAAPAPAPNISKYSAWDTYISNPNFAAFNTLGKEQWNTALSNAYASPGSNLWGVQNLSAPEVAQYLRSKNLLTDQEIAAVHQQFQPRPAPGLSYDRNSEGWGEYFTPEGQFRRFTSTGTPISPMTYPVGVPASLGTPGAMINPYNVAASNLGFMPDSPAYRQELRNKTFAEGGVASFARGGIASLRRFDGGGNVDQPQRSGPQFYDYNVGANARMVDVPGIEYPVLMFFDLQNNRVVVSDEGYWNPNAPIGEDLNKAVAWARDQGLQAGVVVSPYSWDAFGKDAIGEDLESGSAHSRSMPGASFDQLKEYMNAADFVVTDPYVVSAQTATPGVQEKLIQITSMIGDHAQETGKPAWLVLGGSEAPAGTDPNLIYNYTDQLLANAGNKFNQVSVFEGTRDLQPGAYLPTWDYLQASNILAKNGIQPTGNYGQAFENQTAVPATPYVGYDVGSIKVGSVQDFLQGVGVPTQEHFQPGVHIGNAPVNQPAALTGLAGSLPSGWSGYGAEQKIDWYNQNKVTPEQLMGAGAGVTQQDIDWMKKNGYLGSYGTEAVAQPLSQFNLSQSAMETSPIGSPVTQTGIAQAMPQQSLPQPMPQQSLPQPMPQPIPRPIPEPMPDQPRSPFPDFQLNEQEQVMAAQGGIMGYARGGKAMPPRYLRGKTDGMARGGIATTTKAPELRSGDFVFPADIISGFGNGSTAAGMEFVKKAFGAVPVYGDGDGMSDSLRTSIDGVQPAKVADGEAIVRRAKVAEIGGGDLDRGAEELYKMMDRVRHARTGTKKQGRQINPEKFTPGGIAGYAGGGAVAFQTGGAAPAPPTAPLGASNEQNISEWAGPYVGDMLSKTSALTNTPYQAYQGPMVAGTSPLQSKVFGGLEGLSFPGQLGQSFTAQGAYQLPSMTPGGMTGQAAGPTGIASQYMNPYLSAVLTPQLEELRRQSQITQMGTAGKLAQAGAFGGSRQAIMDAETQRNLLQEQNKAIGTGYANAYDRAMGQFNTEQGQARTLADMMAGAGTQQRGIEQEGITALQKQYETELLDPYTKLRFQKEMLQGLPVATASTTANQSQLGETSKNFADLTEALKKLGLG